MLHGTTPRPDQAEIRRLRSLLDEQAIEIVYQPIFDLRDGRVFGYEALTRPSRNSGFAHAGELYETAHRCGMTAQVEGLARSSALRHFQPAESDNYLFLNNSPHVITEDAYLETLIDEMRQCPGLDPRRVVLELTEHAQFDLIGRLAAHTFLLREQGFQIAIDDVGAGTSGLNRILTLRPNHLKLDREMIRSIDEDPFKQNLVRFLVRFGKLSNMIVIAEGIERAEELQVLISLGVDCGQGYYLACPGQLDQTIDPALQRTIIRLAREAESWQFRDPNTTAIDHLATAVPVVRPDDTVQAAQGRLVETGCESGAVICDEHGRLSWVDAWRIHDAMAEQRADRPVHALAVEDVSTVGAGTTLGEVMQQLAISPEGRLTGPVIVQDGAKVVGVVTLRRLLAGAASEHSRLAPHVATLSGLPDRAHADHWLAEQIRLRVPVYVTQIDLEGLDAYNAAYGYEMGDAMLRRLAGSIRALFSDQDPPVPLLAHLHDDHFLLATNEDPLPKLRRLNDAFLSSRAEFFSPVDLAAEAFCGTSAGGNSHTHDLTALRMIVVPDALQQVDSPRELHAILRAAHDQYPPMMWPGKCRVHVKPATTMPSDQAHRASA